MFKPVEATTVQEYLDTVPPEQQEAMHVLHELIKKTVPSLKPHLASAMIGYGSFPYRNSRTKKMMEWPVLGLVARKQYISLYVCAVRDGKYVAESHAKELGSRVDVGKSCIRIRKLDDVDLGVLKKVLKLAEKNPGLEGIGAKK